MAPPSKADGLHPTSSWACAEAGAGKGLALVGVVAVTFPWWAGGLVGDRRWDSKGKQGEAPSEARPSGLDVIQKQDTGAWQDSILSREQLCKHDSR